MGSCYLQLTLLLEGCQMPVYQISSDFFRTRPRQTHGVHRWSIVRELKVGKKKKAASENEEIETVRISVCLHAAKNVPQNVVDQCTRLWCHVFFCCVPSRCRYDNGSHTTELSELKIKFHLKLPFVPTPPPPPPPLPHGGLVFQAEEELAGRRAGRSPSNLCCYYKQGWPGTPHHMALVSISFYGCATSRGKPLKVWY